MSWKTDVTLDESITSVTFFCSNSRRIFRVLQSNARVSFPVYTIGIKFTLSSTTSEVISEQPAAEEAAALADEVESVLRALPLQHRRIIEMRLQGELMHDIADALAIVESFLSEAAVVQQLNHHSLVRVQMRVFVQRLHSL